MRRPEAAEDLWPRTLRCRKAGETKHRKYEYRNEFDFCHSISIHQNSPLDL